ncbi:AAA family ATPase [Rhodobacteraceae bacterium NNCM2]|nr:AAA family ATPase [Coraliihabitans acroporae]
MEIGLSPELVKAERRQITVMFCDMVGSTALSASLDPEDMRDLLMTYREVCAAAVKKFGGYVAQYLGDGVLVYFGFPKAHEGDVENSVRAAQAVVQGLARQRGPKIEVQIAIATGTVVVGDVIAQNTAERDIAIGETPNLAARLIGLAGPGDIVISERTWRLLPDLFDFEDLGENTLKGFTHPVRAWKVVGEPKARSFSHVVHNREHQIPLVAREKEIETLDNLWRKASAGEGQVVMIAGEAGIGKSRLARDFEKLVSAEGQRSRVAKLYCSDNSQTSTLRPFSDHILLEANVQNKEREQDKARKIRDYLAETIRASGADIDLLMEFLSIVTRPSPTSSLHSPEARKLRAFEVLEALTCRASPDEPLLMIVEDLHWSDATTLELLERILIDRVPGLPIMVILTARTEFLPNLPQQPHITTLLVNRFTPEEAALFLERMTADGTLPEAVHKQIIERSDAIPLFLEEVCKATRENIALNRRAHGVGATQSAAAASVPTSLASSLMERLDRLGPVKQVAQVASAIGQVFSGNTLEHIGLLEPEELHEALDQLVQAEIIIPKQKSTEPTYVFKHALVQDAAYSSMLRGERRDLHVKLAAILEDEQAGSAIGQPELIALHCERGGLPGKAIQYWRLAGARARERSANSDAIAHFTNGLELLSEIQNEDITSEIEIELRTNLALALSAVHGGGSKEVGENYSRARSLSGYNAGTVEHFPVMIGCWNNSFASGHINEALSISEEILRIADRKNDASYALEANRVRGMTLFYNGDFLGARDRILSVLGLHDREHHKQHALRFGLDPLVCCHAYLSYAHLFLGQADEARRSGDEGIAEAERINHPYSIAFALAFAAFVRVNLELPDEALDLANRAIGHAVESEFQFFANQQRVVKTWAELQTDAGTVVDMQAAVETFLSSSTNIGSTRIMSMMAEASLSHGENGYARKMLDRALNSAVTNGEMFYLAEIRRLQAEQAYLSDPAGAMGACCDLLTKSLNIADEQSGAIWVRRTAQTILRMHGARVAVEKAERSGNGLDFNSFTAEEGELAARMAAAREMVGAMQAAFS